MLYRTQGHELFSSIEMDVTSKASKQIDAVGPRLKALRIEKKLTLGDVSDRTGLPVSSLSKLENGKVSLSYDKLVRVAHGLGVDIANLISTTAALSSPEAPAILGRRSITKIGDAPTIETVPYIYSYPAAEMLHKSFNPMIVEVKCRSVDEFGDFIRHPGEEFALVLEGEIAFYSEYYAPVILKAGESIYFDSNMGHAYIANIDTPCKLASICSATEAQLKETIPDMID